MGAVFMGVVGKPFLCVAFCDAAAAAAAWLLLLLLLSLRGCLSLFHMFGAAFMSSQDIIDASLLLQVGHSSPGSALHAVLGAPGPHPVCVCVCLGVWVWGTCVLLCTCVLCVCCVMQSVCAWVHAQRCL